MHSYTNLPFLIVWSPYVPTVPTIISLGGDEGGSIGGGAMTGTVTSSSLGYLLADLSIKR